MTTARAGYLCTVVYTLLCIVNSLPAYAEEGGYCTPRSVSLGDSIHFHISTKQEKFDLAVYRYGATKQRVTTIHHCAGGLLAVPESSYAYGCRWPITQSLLIRSEWQSGVYVAEFREDDDDDEEKSAPIVFVVRERIPGSTSKILVSLSASTWEAYNNFGGKSLYNFNSTNDTAATTVSFERPMSTLLYGGDDEQSFAHYGGKLTTWLAHEHIPVEYMMNTDLDRDPGLISNYDVFCVVGHDEYWSRPERTAVQEFLVHGKRLIILGGNTCWWQTRYDDSAQTLTCYKSVARDPMYTVRNDLVTVNWFDTPVDEPENTLIGVSFRNGGYVNDDTFLLKNAGFGDYRVWNAHHWIYEGTNLVDGDKFGYEHAIVGYEVDGTRFYWNNGFPTPALNDDTPTEFQILGISPATVKAAAPGTHHATMGVFTTVNGGAVFNAATTNWVDGLEGDNAVQHITRNVFRRFASVTLPPTVTFWFPYRWHTDTVAGEAQYINSRRIAMRTGDTVVFNVIAADPRGGDLTFEWFVNGVSAYHLQQFTWPSEDNEFERGGVAHVEVRIRNSKDSTVLRWEIYRNPTLKIVSHPHTENQKPKSTYTYKLDVLAAAKGAVHYALLRSPVWLTLNAKGVLSGKITEESGNYDVIVRAHDDLGNSDTQSFTLSVNSPVAVHSGVSPIDGHSLTAYPNPVHDAALISCRLTASASASLNIVSTDGEIIRRIIDTKHVSPGTLTAQWDGRNDLGSSVPNGAYWAVLRLGVVGEARERVLVRELKVGF